MIPLLCNRNETVFQNCNNNDESSKGAHISTWQLISSILFMIFHFTSIFLHSLGLYLLLTIKRTILNTPSTSGGLRTNMVPFTNRWLLVSLSVSEIINSFTSIAVEASFLFDRKSVAVKTATLCLYASAGMALSTVWSITINRLLSLSYPLWYRRYVTKKRFICLFGCLWVIVVGVHVAGAELRIVGLYRDGGNTDFVIGASIGVIMYFSYFAFCVFTYIKIVISIISSSQALDDSGSDNTTLYYIYDFIKREGHTGPLLITLTYMLLVVVPYIAGGICSFYNCSHVAVQVFFVTYSLNNISDALIYCLSNPDIREWLRNKFPSSIHQVTPTNNDEAVS